MNNNHGSRFFDGFLLGLIIGGVAVYLFGTKSGKRLVKKFSEEGLSGFEEILENYGSEDGDAEPESRETEAQERQEKEPTTVASKPKKRFFKRFRRVD